jgi:hypothetical protein
MNRDEILNMEAGREMDELIAKAVMGYYETTVKEEFYEGGRFVLKELNALTREGLHGGYIYHYQIKGYSTDIAAAWQVVEKLKPSYQFGLWSDDFDGAEGFGCRFRLKGTIAYDRDIVWTETAPLAICRASLLATLDSQPTSG